jgi:succinoglycan biosynthesis transport protein ExoP
VSSKRSPAELVADRSTSLFSESLRMARASIFGVRTAKPVKVIAFTSAVPAEGKTTTALALSRMLAINGSRTLLIDCDVRRASLRSLTGAEAKAGLVEILEHGALASDAIVSDTVEGLDLLTVLRPYYSSEDLFGGENMARLLQELSGQYDHVVLDLPPVLGLADSRFVAALADAVIMVVRWGKTPLGAVSTAVQQLQADEAAIMGVIMTMVDPSSEAIGGMYYSQKYGSYYRAR